MNGVPRLFYTSNFMILAIALSACTINVDLHISTDKPIALNVALDKPIEVKLDKPIEVKLGADIAVTQLPPIDVAVTKLPPIQAEAKIGITNPLRSKEKEEVK